MDEQGKTTSSPSTPEVSTLTRLGLRRAGIVEGTVLTIYRLRKPSKANTQKVRDITKRLNFKTADEANTALQLKVQEWEARRDGANHTADPEETDPTTYLKAENAEDLANVSDEELEKLTSPA